MSETVDARGLSCPQPVLDVLNKIAAVGAGRIEILLDSEASKENVTRAARSKGWRVDFLEEEGGEYRMLIAKD